MGHVSDVTFWDRVLVKMRNSQNCQKIDLPDSIWNGLQRKFLNQFPKKIAYFLSDFVKHYFKRKPLRSGNMLVLLSCILIKLLLLLWPTGWACSGSCCCEKYVKLMTLLLLNTRDFVLGTANRHTIRPKLSWVQPVRRVQIKVVMGLAQTPDMYLHKLLCLTSYMTGSSKEKLSYQNQIWYL